MSEAPMPTVKLAFERELVTVAIDKLVPVKAMRANYKQSKKYLQILSSIKAIGIVEPPAIVADATRSEMFLLLDGHLRVEALKELGAAHVRCLVATDDEAYTYNKRINRLTATQEHRMVVNVMERGVASETLAASLGLNPLTIQRRSRLMNGICPEAAELLRDAPCPMAVFDTLRQMKPLRQIEAAEIMTGQANYTAVFARTIFMATPPEQLVPPRSKVPKKAAVEQMARLERELVGLQSQVKAVEDSYGVDNLRLTLAQAYLKKLLGNARIVRWLGQYRPEFLEQFELIADVRGLPGLSSE
ncbi:MAG: RepB-like nuclease [Novosphingobium lindaniclasticum]|jgi:hypothetical protein|uniref:plasmid partitioning protein RepB C-terminal domain-containing protein n=1 Tax=Novosphingobium lindaniclasticum TaxID=1329895 RepID=UPI0024094B25|nr:plasmid partitioning protein RepB C-terminal domain-containing protein [Novosphingobium lindaniclasticum]MDF2637862.1 RepB-like nuclease [Novosphingobium lindaniclasticum]